MISTGADCASRSAQSVLPAPVGPVSRNTGGRSSAAGVAAAPPAWAAAGTSAPPQEQLVELL